ncbi:MAG: UvrD-helicase domain-containing protein [bacterium]
MNYLSSLNTEQQKAVLATDGPVLIVAGAGAGKTKTITHRILHLIKTGVAPESILAITFTNKAAKEMKERVMKLLDNKKNDQDCFSLENPEFASENTLPETEYSPAGEFLRARSVDLRNVPSKHSPSAHSVFSRPFVSTFHSLGVHILKENAEKLGLPRYFTIFDKSDSKKAMKEALTQLGIDPKEHLDKVGHIISKEKGSGTSVGEYMENGAYDYTSEITKKVWQIYENILKRDGALDFDDLLLKTLGLFKRFPDVLERYQNRFQYIHIDEYQDTNKVQNDIVELLAQKYKNICVVGDTDQNIYSWRGAEIKNMLRFEKIYPTVTTIFLEQNYRSTKNILAVANEIIQKNEFRIPKKLFTENEIGEEIGVFEARNETDEAQFIAFKSKNLIENGVSADEIAVLYRANFQSRALEEAFLAFNVPYQMLGTKFFERKEIKDVLSFVRASLNYDALGDFARIINIPPRGIGKTSVQKIVAGAENDLPASMKIKLQNFRETLLDFRNVLEKEKPSDAIRYIIEKSGIEKMYSTGTEEDTERLENIMELVSLAKEYDEYESGNSEQIGTERIEKFLTDSSLAGDQDSLDGQKTGVRLMTVHASKGLEFPYVFISGLESDLFPHKGFGDKKTKEDREEERRLFYVAITRAGKKLFLTHAQTRTIFGNTEINSPSEFLDDIPEKYTQKESYAGQTTRAPLFSIDF